MRSSHYDADALDHLAVRFDFHTGNQDRGPYWTIYYASGRSETETSPDRVQQIMMANHEGNRRTLR